MTPTNFTSYTLELRRDRSALPDQAVAAHNYTCQSSKITLTYGDVSASSYYFRLTKLGGQTSVPGGSLSLSSVTVSY